MSRKISKMFVVVAMSVAMLVAALPAWAHHAFAAAFDADKPVEVKGVLTEIRLENPHSWFFIDVNGKVANWGFEASTPTSLIRSGFSPKSLKVGDQVTIKGSHARDLTKNAGAAREITLADGRSFIVGPQGNEPAGSPANR
jgi:Family of unknown function (DUF6152)